MNWSIFIKQIRRSDIPSIFSINFENADNPFFSVHTDKDGQKYFVNDTLYAYLFGFEILEETLYPLVKLTKEGISEKEWRKADSSVAGNLTQQFCIGFNEGREQYKEEVSRLISGNVGFQISNEERLTALPNLLQLWKDKAGFDFLLDTEKLREKGKYQAFYWLAWQDLNNNPLTGFIKYNSKEEVVTAIESRQIVENLKKHISNQSEFLNLERLLIKNSLLNQTDYSFKEKKEVIAFAFILEEKKLVSFETYAEFERVFGERYSADLNKDFAPVKIKNVSKQISRLKSCFRSSGLSGFETT